MEICDMTAVPSGAFSREKRQKIDPSRGAIRGIGMKTRVTDTYLQRYTRPHPVRYDD